MTAQERRDAYFQWIVDYTGQDWETEADAPSSIDLLLTDMVTRDPGDLAKTSESIDGLSQTWGGDGVMESWKLHLRPYRKVRFL